MSRADPQAVWEAWTDVTGWGDSGHIASARVDGRFREGAVIRSKAKGLPASRVTVTHVEPPRLFVDEARSPDVRMSFDHEIDAVEDGGTSLTERVVVDGPLAGLVVPLLRKRLVALFEASTAHVARTAEQVRDRSG